MAFPIEDEEVDGHNDATKGSASDRRLRSSRQVVYDHGEVEVAVGAEIASGARAERDDTDGVGGFDDAFYGGENFFFRDASVEMGGRGRHCIESLYLDTFEE